MTTMARYHADRTEGRPYLWILTPVTKPPLSEVSRVIHDIRLLSEGNADALARKDEILAAKTDLVRHLEQAETTVEAQALPLPPGADWASGPDKAIPLATAILDHELPGPRPPEAARTLAAALSKLPMDSWQLSGAEIRAALSPAPPRHPHRPAPPAR